MKSRVCQAREAAAVKQFGFKAVSKRLGVGIIIAVAASTHALLRTVASEQGLEAGGRVLTALVGVHNESGRGPAHDQGTAQRFADQVFAHRVAHVPAHDLARAAVEPDG